ncbi:hypothetical protein [Niabella hirudinis]|uniref:hypothetical protein n=1 Tax=Niabella hirudinis TaxID=1285929 RepID=UPI003EBD97CC
MKVVYCLLVACCCNAYWVQGQKISSGGLPLYEKTKVRNREGDWLIKPVRQKAAVYKTTDGQLAFSNGLMTRLFTIGPNGATIGLDNLVTNESLVRAVGPEAVVWINGQEIKVGGLTGQPIGNYLLHKWIPQLKQDPLAMRLVSYKTNPIRARFEWNRRTSWMPKERPWPPPGMELTFTYKADATLVRNLFNANASDRERTVLFKDDFLQVQPQWKVVSEGTDARFNNEGKAGEILAPTNALVYAERDIPAGTQVLICKLNSGTDGMGNKSPYNNYGPGVGLLFVDGSTSKINIQPSGKRITINHDDRGLSWTAYNPGKDVWIRILLLRDKMVCSRSDDGTVYTDALELPLKAAPAAIRIGKTDAKGGSRQNDNKGAIGRSKIDEVLLLGAPREQQARPDYLLDLEVNVHYELYDGLPLMSKWVSIKNNGPREIVINNVKSEHLAMAEVESEASGEAWKLPPVFTETDYAFGGMTAKANAQVVSWQPDPSYTTQVNYALKNPTVLVCKPEAGIGQELGPSGSFEGIRLWELLWDGSDRERRGLAQRKLYRTIAPWITENPMLMHVSSAEDKAVKEAIDQCADVGFEMVIMTFGSGANLEDTSAANLERMKKLEDYARSKNIVLGGYSLLASRSIDAQTDVVMPTPDLKPKFSKSPCLQSAWGQEYFKKLYGYYAYTGQGVFEHDGSYPGDICASTTHPGHKGLEDSQWKQFTEIRDFYRWCRGKGIYLNVPDWYFLNGSSKTGMGYRETNWSLAREYQEIIERQNIYDGTWEKTPSMGWMFVPLVQYHGGGAAATIEPLKDHLPHYGQRLANLFGAGVQACYRGPRLYDSPQTRNLVKKWVGFYKKHRAVLDGDIIHIRRADGKDYDALLHVDPAGKEKGLLMIYNPLEEPITRDIEIDLYYTGLKHRAVISENDGLRKSLVLDGTRARLTVTIPAKSQQWFLFEAPR